MSEEKVLSTLTKDQQTAFSKIETWLEAADAPYFILTGGAGTGKSFLIQSVCRLLLNKRTVYLTAPTNKAANVLTEMAKEANLSGVVAKTIYSLLGLKMVAVEEDLVLSLDDVKTFLPDRCVLILDEAGMTQKEIVKILVDVVKLRNVKLLCVGDPLQLPPVNENRSKIWKLIDYGDDEEPSPFYAELTEVVRFDSSLLKLSTKIRKAIISKAWESDSYDQRLIRKTSIDSEDEQGKITQGVLVHNSYFSFVDELLSGATPNAFKKRKVIAWRNKTVNKFNSLIREQMGFTEDFVEGDLLMVAAPVEQDGVILATIDEEIQVQGLQDSSVSVGLEYRTIRVLKLQCSSGRRGTLWLNICQEDDKVQAMLSNLATLARRSDNRTQRAKAWEEFWNIKNKFHKVRYAYAITAHRAQGSTLHEVFVDQSDILANSDERTAMKCLLVACTRPTNILHSY